jgi:FAD/FMN-containing dehydrogenase
MSSYSEYLSRKMQRTPQILDTRPRRDAGHQTEVVKRLAASGNLESATAASACVLVLNTPSTRNPAGRTYNGGHNVQDTSVYNEYTAGRAVAQASMPANAPPTYITKVCYSSSSMPEYNDRLAADAQLALVQDAKNKYARGYSTASCCIVCGKPPVFASGCNCSLTTAQRQALKNSAAPPLHTIEPNANVA